MNCDNELWLMNIQGVFQLWFFLIAWGRERGCGNTGVENWWHLIGLKKTYNRYSVGRKKGKAGGESCQVFWEMKLIVSLIYSALFPNVLLELSQQSWIWKWESLLKHSLTATPQFWKTTFPRLITFSCGRELNAMGWVNLLRYTVVSVGDWCSCFRPVT